MRTLFGIGTPRGLQGHVATLMALVLALWARVVAVLTNLSAASADGSSAFTPHHRFELLPVGASEEAV